MADAFYPAAVEVPQWNGIGLTTLQVLQSVKGCICCTLNPHASIMARLRCPSWCSLESPCPCFTLPPGPGKHFALGRGKSPPLDATGSVSPSAPTPCHAYENI